MDLECAICLDPLYRAGIETYSNVLQILIRHKNLNEPQILLKHLGYNCRGELDKNSMSILLSRLKQAIDAPRKIPEWILPIMHAYMRVMGTPCGHLFHFWCLEEWNLQGVSRILDCPYCRQNYLSDQVLLIKFGPAEEESEQVVLESPSLNGFMDYARRAKIFVITLPFRLWHLRYTQFLTLTLQFGNVFVNFRQCLATIPPYFGNQNVVLVEEGTDEPIVPVPVQKRFVLYPIVVNALQILTPIILLLKFFLNTQHYVDELKQTYDEGEDEELLDEYYLDSYSAIQILISCLICIMVDWVLSYFGPLDDKNQ